MKRLLVLLAALAISACAIPVRVVNPPPVTPHKFGASTDTNPAMFWQAVNNAAIVAAGNNGTTIVFDTTAGGTQSLKYLFMYRLMIVGYCTTQNVTALYQVQEKGSTTWVTAAGGASVTMTASAATPPVATEVDFLVQGQESRLEINNGATGPAACNFGLALFYTRELGQ
jgi:hypothetical protein